MPKAANKLDRLRQAGILNAQPQRVQAAWFQLGGFFDANDLVQVKYEMLRQVHVDKHSVSESADAFGLSRPSFYQAQAALQKNGLFGLMPHKRGPQGGHKLTTEVMEFVAQQRTADPFLTAQQLAESVRKRFQVQVHARSIQRQLVRQKKRS